jgi:hypothetical protein
MFPTAAAAALTCSALSETDNRLYLAHALHAAHFVSAVTALCIAHTLAHLKGHQRGKPFKRGGAEDSRTAEAAALLPALTRHKSAWQYMLGSLRVQVGSSAGVCLRSSRQP